jgi:hypothetical protein
MAGITGGVRVDAVSNDGAFPLWLERRGIHMEQGKLGLTLAAMG